MGSGLSSATINLSFTKPEADIPYDPSINEGVSGGYLVQGAAATINPTWTANATGAMSTCIANFIP